MFCGLMDCRLYLCWVFGCFFFFKQKTAYEMRISDWSSDVCSSDLALAELRSVRWTHRGHGADAPGQGHAGTGQGFQQHRRLSSVVTVVAPACPRRDRKSVV